MRGLPAVKAVVHNVSSLVRFMLAVRRFRAAPIGERSTALPALREAWGNTGFVASLAYLSAVLDYGQNSEGPILECGSGLTTLLLTLLAGPRVWSLEHMVEWRRQVQGRLWLAGARGHVLFAPLR